MRSALIWLTFAGAILLARGTVNDWNHQFLQRFSRNFLRNHPNDGNSISNGLADINDANDLDDHFSPFKNDAGIDFRNFGVRAASVSFGADNGVGQQQTEVYGIVEPNIEDMPCVDRPCNANEDCCPTGVCVNTYGEGKCIYVYGRKRDYCRRNADCEQGMSCQRSASGNFVCQLNQSPPPSPQAAALFPVSGAAKAIELAHHFGESCVSSSDCNIAKGMCCQLQRSHHRLMPKKLCAYFHDPFMCIDIMPSDDEENRASRILSSFSQRRI